MKKMKKNQALRNLQGLNQKVNEVLANRLQQQLLKMLNKIAIALFARKSSNTSIKEIIYLKEIDISTNLMLQWLLYFSTFFFGTYGVALINLVQYVDFKYIPY